VVVFALRKPAPRRAAQLGKTGRAIDSFRPARFTRAELSQRDNFHHFALLKPLTIFREVLDCASPLALSERQERFDYSHRRFEVSPLPKAATLPWPPRRTPKRFALLKRSTVFREILECAMPVQLGPSGAFKTRPKVAAPFQTTQSPQQLQEQTNQKEHHENTKITNP